LFRCFSRFKNGDFFGIGVESTGGWVDIPSVVIIELVVSVRVRVKVGVRVGVVGSEIAGSVVNRTSNSATEVEMGVAETTGDGVVIAVELATGNRTSGSAGAVPEQAGITRLKIMSKGKNRRIGVAPFG
jgi:hypothetical protein